MTGLASKLRPRARTLQAILASLLASAIARTLRCSRFLAASIHGLSPCRSQLCGLINTTQAACTNRTRRYRLPRFDILPRMVRSPVDICFGTRPSQAAKSRPLENASPVPIAATIALEMIGPMPGTLTSRLQPASWCARAVISPDKCSMRSSSRRQSSARCGATGHLAVPPVDAATERARTVGPAARQCPAPGGRREFD